MRNFLFAFISLLLLASCENDVDINAPAVETPVIYALIDPSDSIQYIRISRTFQTKDNGTPAEEARKKENLYLQDLKVTIRNTRTGTVYNFVPTNEIPKDPGFFTNEVNILYTDNGTMGGGNTKPASSAFHYLQDVLELTIFSPATQVTYKASAQLVDYARIDYQNSFLYLYTYDNKGNPKAMTVPKSFSANNGALYDLTYRVWYDELTNGNPVAARKFIDVPIVTNVETDPKISKELGRPYKSNEFLSFLRENLKPTANTLRRFVRLEISAYGGNPDVRDLYNLFKPSLSITQKKPVYTNISGALGIFATRNRTYKVIKMGDQPGPGVQSPDSTRYLIVQAASFEY